MATSNSNDLTEQQSNSVVIIDDECYESFLKLFQVIRPVQTPYCMRNFPRSFFDPPQTGTKSPSVSHSRENSADSAFSSDSNRLPTPHSRAHSSPATTNIQPQVQHVHMKQKSCDFQLEKEDGDLPSGWEEAKTPEGQIYYLKYVVIFVKFFVVFYQRVQVSLLGIELSNHVT